MILRKILFFLLISFIGQAQLLKDAWARKTIKLGLDAMYSFDFNESNATFNQIKTKYPNHPSSYLLLAMQMEWQYFPLQDHPNQKITYKSLLEKSYNLASNAYEKNEEDLEAAFFCSASLGFLAAQEADSQNFMKAVSYAKNAYGFLKIGIDKVDLQPEFLYATGIYHYYRIAYPELHPIIKPFMWFFKDGNKRLGLSQLEKAGTETVFVQNEAQFYLPYILNKYEGTPASGLGISANLIKDHPNNLIYILQRAELLTLTKNFEAAEDFCEKLLQSKNKYFQGCYYTLEGMKYEAQKDYTKAEAFYLKSTFFPFEERFTKDIRGLSYLGLARIHLKKNQKAIAKKYVHLAENFVEYKNSLEELERLKK